MAIPMRPWSALMENDRQYERSPKSFMKVEDFVLTISLVFPPGYSHHAPLHQDLQLEQWQHLLPYNHWQPGERKQATLRDLPGKEC